MNRSVIYLLLAGMAVVVQTVLLPQLLPAGTKPDLLLILVVYMGLHEGPLRGGLLVYLMGWAYDGVAGAFPGLHGFVLLAIFLGVRGIVTRVNTESAVLLLLLVAAGTVLQVGMTTFSLDFFSGTAGVWPQMFWQLPAQLLLNTIAAYFLLRLSVWLQRTFMPRRNLPGLRKLNRRYES